MILTNSTYYYNKNNTCKKGVCTNGIKNGTKILEYNYFSHQSPTYGSPFDMLESFGISFISAAENIAKGQATAQRVVLAWMNSTEHRTAILDNDFIEVGVGYVNYGTPIWTQMFINT